MIVIIKPANYKRLLSGYNLLILDEAQYIADIGRKAKLMIDEIKPLHIILTGSSAVDIVVFKVFLKLLNAPYFLPTH